MTTWFCKLVFNVVFIFVTKNAGGCSVQVLESHHPACFPDPVVKSSLRVLQKNHPSVQSRCVGADELLVPQGRGLDTPHSTQALFSGPTGSSIEVRMFVPRLQDLQLWTCSARRTGCETTSTV